MSHGYYIYDLTVLIFSYWLEDISYRAINVELVSNDWRDFIEFTCNFHFKGQSSHSVYKACTFVSCVYEPTVAQTAPAVFL